jgi:hypothetical protein
VPKHLGMGSGDLRRVRRGGPVAECPDHAESWVVSRGRRTTKAGIKQVFRCSAEGAPTHSFSVLVEAAPMAHRRRAKSAPPVPCPVPEHAGSNVISKGVRETNSGRRRVLRCEPLVGTPHTFRVVPTAAAAVPMPTWSPPPPCSEHPGSHVVRDGRYGSSTRKRRQRYRCYPSDDRSQFHRFTPVLPRDHVHGGAESCGECEELRGLHRGDATVSRRQSWSARLVAETLRDLSRGTTYADASVRIREATGRTRSRKNSGNPRRGYTGSRLAKNAWHIAADWCETYSPVLWDHVDGKMRAEAQEAVRERERRLLAGEPNPAPLTVLIDDIPINARFMDENGKRVSRRDYFVLVLAEVRWHTAPDDRVDRRMHLRLVRALPTNDHHAWKLLFDELGYNPDFIVADAGTGLLKAVREFYKGGATFVPSLFHVRKAIEEGLLKTPGAWVQATSKGAKELRSELVDHLAGLRKKNLTTLSAGAWKAWWDDLEALLIMMNVSVEPTRKRRRNYEQTVASVLPTLAAHPHLPASTGGLEVTLRKRVEPLLANRAHAFANIERTNRLFDLAVCNDVGLFNDMPVVVDLLRSDSTTNDGWSTPLRAVTDPQPPGTAPRGQRYSSLRDQQLIRDIARSKGLA